MRKMWEKMFRTLISHAKCNKPAPTSKFRCLSTTPRGYVQYSDDNNKRNFLKRWITLYVNYIKNYHKILDRKFPMHLYRVFSVGAKEFYADLKRYLHARKIYRSGGLSALTREQLQLWHTFPMDLVKISPLFITSPLPFANYVIFPVAFFFPRLLLTSHFWSLEQRHAFALHYHKKRLRHNKPLLRCVQSRLESIEKPVLKTRWSGVVAALGSGTHPTAAQIISCIELFSGPPYSLDSLTRKHTRELLAIHGMYRWLPNRKKRLLERGMLIKTMDDSIKREGGVKKLPNDAIRWALLYRGVNPANMRTESMQNWLEQWLEVSTNIDQNSISVLLHTPILLAYNYPTNWTLLYH